MIHETLMSEDMAQAYARVLRTKDNWFVYDILPYEIEWVSFNESARVMEDFETRLCNLKESFFTFIYPHSI